MSDEDRNKPSMEEILGGRDVAIGKEIVEGLVAEEVGMPIYRYFPEQIKKNVTVDRTPGDDDYSVRETTEVPQQLQGIVLPTGKENEFVFFGIQEQGFIFRTRDQTRANHFDYRIVPSYRHICSKFSQESRNMNAEFILMEDDRPDDYQQALVASINTEREKVAQRKASRGEHRKNLLSSIFKPRE